MRHMQPCTYFSSSLPGVFGSLCHLTLCSGEIYIPAAWSLSLYWRWISRMICSNARNVAAQCWIEPQSRADYPNLVWPRTLVLAWELSQEEWMSVTFHILLPQGGQRWRWARQKSQSYEHNPQQFLFRLGSSWSTRFSQPQCCQWRSDTIIIDKILKSVTCILL